MSIIGASPSNRERSLAREEAAAAIESYGDCAATILLMKAQQTRSAERRAIYMLARQIALGEG